MTLAYANPPPASSRASCAPLHEVLRACHAGELACRRAADRLSDDAVCEVLVRHAHERARFAREIETELSSLGVEPPSGRDSGDCPSEIRIRDHVDILTSCIAADEALLVAYSHAREAALPRDVEAVLERQARAIARGIDQLKALATR